jgi:hypothetical protein
MDYYSHNNKMARPKKDPSLRKDVDLRIPVTEEQKKTIAEAAASDQSDVAAWIRPIILRAAERRLLKEGK